MSVIDDAPVQSVSVLGLRPGDTLIVKMAQSLTPAQADEVKRRIRAQLTVDVPVLIVCGDVEFSVARPTP